VQTPQRLRAIPDKPKSDIPTASVLFEVALFSLLVSGFHRFRGKRKEKKSMKRRVLGEGYGREWGDTG